MMTSIRPVRPVHRMRWMLPLLALLALSSCSEQLKSEFVPNLAPTVRLTHAPVDANSKEKYAYRMNWVGYDPDGRVDHYLYAVDPKDLDTPDSLWVRTTNSEEIIYFSASIPDEPVNVGNPVASEFHVFGIRAVDNQGQQSPTVYRAFFAYTAAPIIQVLTPRPSASSSPIVTPSVRIQWGGIDLDGVTGKPTQYRFQLFGQRNPDFPAIPDFIKFATAPATRDSFRRLYAPAFGPSEKCPTCSAWDSSPPDIVEKQYTNLIPKQQYLFVVSGFDDAGAYDPVWRTDKNMLTLVVSYAGTLGPTITMFNEFFNYTYPTGGYANDPSRYFEVEIPADQPVTFNWFAEPPPGASMRRYRWVMDLLDLDDNTPRTNELTDWYHWSAYSLNTLSATVGPFIINGESHLFYIEAEDNNGLRSLGIIKFTVIRPTFASDLLFVNDTRFELDQVSHGVLFSPVGPWPSKAELDTFFYARGNFPWKGYPSGTLSTPGVFAGYHFDTLSTKGILTGIVPLSVLGKYKFVIWMTDATAATLTGPPTDVYQGICSLRYMTGPGQPSTISTYCKQGGSVWLLGGGGAGATLSSWNRRGTDLSVFTDADFELVPGRYMYDFPHWRSEVSISVSQQGGLNYQIAQFHSQTPSRGWTGAPDYTKLVAPQPTSPLGARVLEYRDGTYPDDAIPPLRDGSTWYNSFFASELITRGNFIREDLNGSAPGGEQSTLDTLFLAFGGPGLDYRPMMTYYHGLESPAQSNPLPGPGGALHSLNIFSGFPFWYFRRVQEIMIADFVLQDIWGLVRDPIDRGTTTAQAARTTTAAQAARAATTAQSTSRTPTTQRRASRSPRE